MTIVLLVAGSLAVLVGAMLVIGSRLPQSHTASRTQRFAKPPELLFPLVADVKSFAGFDELKLEIVEQQAPNRLVTRIGPGLPFGGTWTYELRADGGGTLLTITERGEVYPPLFRFVSRFVLGHTGSMEKYFKQLSAKL